MPKTKIFNRKKFCESLRRRSSKLRFEALGETERNPSAPHSEDVARKLGAAQEAERIREELEQTYEWI